MLQLMIISFALASLVLIALPGPDYAIVTRNALVGGRCAGIRTMLGGTTGLTVHATAAVLGLSALLAASATAYASLKLLGVVYLVYLGLKLLRSAGSDEAEKPGRTGHWFAQGFLSSALNVKVAIFFLTFLPQFLPTTGSTLVAALGLSAMFAAIYVAWFSGLVVLVAKVSGVLRRPHVKAWIERVTGSALVAFGIRLSTVTR
jgi:threonine/homoserine/homoserine lactone efflux protein